MQTQTLLPKPLSTCHEFSYNLGTVWYLCCVLYVYHYFSNFRLVNCCLLFLKVFTIPDRIIYHLMLFEEMLEKMYILVDVYISVFHIKLSGVNLRCIEYYVARK